MAALRTQLSIINKIIQASFDLVIFFSKRCCQYAFIKTCVRSLEQKEQNLQFFWKGKQNETIFAKKERVWLKFHFQLQRPAHHTFVLNGAC